MNKLILAAMAAASIFTASAASASELFTLDTADSSVTVSHNSGFCVLGSCALNASLATPFASQTLNVGQSATFDFANFSISSGLGGENYSVEAVLAFTTPNAGPASTSGVAKYLTVGGVVNGGKLTWADPVQTLTATDGSVFTVSFANLSGFEVGKNIADDVTITLNSAVPEPASWALMIGGLGLTGFALRRRRVAMAAVA